MKFLKFKPISMGSGVRCPDCGSSDDVIPWGKGWCCRDCGYEWD